MRNEKELQELREHGEKVAERVRRIQQREFFASVAKERSRRTAAEVEAAYVQAMKDKAGK